MEYAPRSSSMQNGSAPSIRNHSCSSSAERLLAPSRLVIRPESTMDTALSVEMASAHDRFPKTVANNCAHRRVPVIKRPSSTACAPTAVSAAEGVED